MLDGLRGVLNSDPRIAYALVFGSQARSRGHALSDVDVAVGVAADQHLDPLAIGELVARLEAVAGRPVDLVLINEAPPGLAYRVFRDGQPILIRDRHAFASRLARAVLEYLDFRPVEELFTRGVLGAGDGR